MKPKWFELLADVPTQIVDQNAATVRELEKQMPYIGHTKMKEIARANCESGKWEKVFKHVEGRLIPAYRKKK